MSRPGTFERVYATLKERLREGSYRPGDRLEPAALSQDLNASVTPVRDALHRLTGERLVEAPRHEGFRVPMLTESALRHLYGWHLDLLLLALARRHSALAGSEPDEGQSEGAVRKVMFGQFVQTSGNPEHAHAYRAIVDRLQPFERFEQRFLDATAEETDAIVEALRGEDRRVLRSMLIRYHRRRQRVIPELLAQLHRPQS